MGCGVFLAMCNTELMQHLNTCENSYTTALLSVRLEHGNNSRYTYRYIFATVSIIFIFNSDTKIVSNNRNKLQLLRALLPQMQRNSMYPER